MNFKALFVCLLVLSFWSICLNAQPSTQQMQLPLLFERNAGQEDSPIQYFARGSAYNTLLSAHQAQFVFRNEDGSRSELGISLAGSQSLRTIEQVGTAEIKLNYYTGTDPSKWKTEVPAFGAVIYELRIM